MNRLKRPVGRASAALACAASALALALPAIAWGDAIPRPPGAVDHRGYELVSLADKGVAEAGAGGLLTDDGSRAFYDLAGGVPGVVGGAEPKLFARRTPDGWVSSDALPPRAQLLGGTYFAAALAPDLSGWIASAQDGLGSTDFSPDMSLARLDGAGHQTLLHTFPVYYGVSGADTVASDDLTHVLTNAPEQIDPSHQPGTRNIYDVGSGTPELVSVMPGTGLAPACGVPADGFPAAASEHWLSTDGMRMFFSTSGDTCSDPRELYMRDRANATTTLVSGPPLAGDVDNGVDPVFLQASASSDPASEWVIYSTATSLDPADDVDGDATDQDVYRWTPAGGNVCLTCIVGSAQVRTGTTRIVASQDGSHVYFTSALQLADAPASAGNGSPNIYVWHNNTVHYVARTDAGNGISDRTTDSGDITPDGNTLIFRTRRPELDALSGSTNNGVAQYYRYDDRDQSITCLSCAPGGATTAVSGSLSVNNHAVRSDVRSMSADGRMVFFPSSDPLVPEDVNGGPDIYEWHDGVVKLITSGTERYPGHVEPVVYTVSPSGHDVLFMDYARLTAQSLDNAGKVYDARIDGGFPPPPTPPSGCAAEQCHGLPSAPPLLSDPGSAGYVGGGNATEPHVTFALAGVSRAQRAHAARSGRLVLTVRVAPGGRVSAFAQAKLGKRIRRVAHAARTVSAAGTVKLTLQLSDAARAQLARTGRLRLVVGVDFSHATTTERLVVTLKAPTSGHGARASSRASGRGTADGR